MVGSMVITDWGNFLAFKKIGIPVALSKGGEKYLALGVFKKKGL